MSKTRQLIAEMDAREIRSDKDYEYLLETWDIPADENITAHEANMWLHAQLNQHAEMTLVAGGGHQCGCTLHTESSEVASLWTVLGLWSSIS